MCFDRRSSSRQNLERRPDVLVARLGERGRAHVGRVA